jgi:hypothetical protein
MRDAFFFVDFYCFFPTNDGSLDGVNSAEVSLVFRFGCQNSFDICFRRIGTTDFLVDRGTGK